jgi:hypothetical protein
VNVQSIWAGEAYAYTSYRPNNTFVTNARKGIAKKVIKEREWGNERMTSYVILDWVDEETGEVKRENLQVRARDVIDFWDSYENERKAVYKEREERERQRLEDMERRRAEREAALTREREERLAFERVETERKETLVTKFVERTGIPRDAVYSIGPGNIQLDRSMIELWLSTDGGASSVGDVQPSRF